MTERVKLRRRRGFTRLSAKRQVTLPVRVVEAMGLEAGDELQVEAEGTRIVLSRPETGPVRRLEALRRVAGSLPGVWRPGDLERLRSEWR